ncbi:GUN4 domain-containing protein [Anabaena sphaerica FACHB-251]|uniref:non-specific serine/threonine protein kinase n=1 Tax=Anabaena sphaerica FACHB-251 TaxID=2692883 RepID=A0A926WLH0_9NOST|nr:serine/threonine-protein kinase [Anabaena sphaerica]MBD2296312.1 GUN4 domain-containing protein [Anabaena sphaerica FACHB-251]
MKLWQPNQHLNNGRFIIQKVLGSGGFGVTYSVRERDTYKLFVLKTLNHIQQNKQNFKQLQVKFVNEALRLAKCSHPHIVKVYEVIQEDGLWCMVMEYIDGQDIANYIDINGVLSEQEALLYIDQIGQALEYIHHQGFLHRDIKPSNIILRRGKSEVVLIDFGLAREYTNGQIKSMTNERTDGYAPIEQYKRRGNFGAYTDIYALAATLYTLLTKEVPIPAEYRNRNNTLPPPKQFNSQISDRVNDAIVQGMALEPENRPQSIFDFRELLGLASILSSQDIEEKLISAVGMDYTRLRDLLASGRWKEADEETTRVMLAVVGKENDGCLNEKDIYNFPCRDIRTIDQLWVKYSHGRFGFSVQKRIYQSMRGTKNFYRDFWNNFGEQVGWRKDKKWMYYEDLTFNITAPEAHLPSGIFWFDSWWGRYGWFLLDGVEKRFYYLVARVIKCNI